LAVLLALVAALSGCIKPRLHRPENLEVGDDYTVAYIEFDDQGEPWDPTQLERAIQTIERANRQHEKIGVVVFVHGWQNDASNRDDRKKENNVEGFKRLLDVTSQQLKRTGEIAAGAKLVGVYIGWRGKSSPNKLVKPFTFYSRRGAGQRVAGVSTTEAIVRVMKVAKRNPESVGVVIGHSFGGMIVEQALSQTMVSLAIDDNSTIEPLADLVILVNPASQSIEAKRMLSILERNRLKFYRTDNKGERRVSPFIVSVTSTADTATGKLYPTALGIKAISKRFREYGPGDCSPGATQKAYYRRTAGHNQILHSHVITAEPLQSQAEPADLLGFEETVDEETGDVQYSFTGRDHRFVMKSLPYSYNDTPYWIMNVPPELIKDHSDIFTFNTLQMVRALVHISGASAGQGHSVLVRENGVRPVATYPLPDRGIAFLERSRRFFVVTRERPRPLALSCLPAIVDPDSMVGVVYEGTEVSLITSGQETGKKKPKVRTDVVTFDYAQPGTLDFTPIKANMVFTAAVGNPDTGELYLAAEGALYRANLDHKKPKAELFGSFDEPKHISEMELDRQRDRIFAVDRPNRALYVIHLQDDAPTPQRITADLGIPGEMIMTPAGKMLILDTGAKQVMELDCTGDRGCDPPIPTIRHDGFVRPTTLSLGAHGTVWVGDAGAESIFAFDSDGNLSRVLDSIAGFGE
jgi:pimeloyl-ACP methyl ester carboxylesterase